MLRCKVLLNLEPLGELDCRTVSDQLHRETQRTKWLAQPNHIHPSIYSIALDFRNSGHSSSFGSRIQNFTCQRYFPTMPRNTIIPATVWRMIERLFTINVVEFEELLAL
jgi:hypothetical protein